MSMRFFWHAVFVSAFTLSSAQAQTVEEFYRRSGLTIIVGTDAGGAHDAYARVLARHIGRHIPGNPNVIVQNMGGAGGVVAANHLSNVAAKDGTIIGAIFPGSVIEPLLQEGNQAKYDPRQINWIGNIASLQLTCVTWHTSPVKTVDQARAREVVMGGESPAAGTGILPNVMNQLLGTKFKLITGYATSALRLALERGEVEGICGFAYATIVATAPAWIDGKRLNFLAQSGLERAPDLPDVPLIRDFAGNAEDAAVFRLLDIRSALGRPYLAPPGVPADRLSALREAFARTMKDPDYLAETAKAKQDVDFLEAKGMLAVVQEAYAMSPQVVERVKGLIRPPKTP